MPGADHGSGRIGKSFNADPHLARWQRHWILERNSILLLLGILIVIAIGGLVEVVPLFYLRSTIETAPGMRPYTPLELAGRNIYVREGCYLCHSQMIRALRDEVERYGHYSLAAESMYDHPFQWGSKRNGPDLARVGGKYSDDWHRDHLMDPRRWCRVQLCRPIRGYFPPISIFAHRRRHESAVACSAYPIPMRGSPTRSPTFVRKRRMMPGYRDTRQALSKSPSAEFRRPARSRH